MKSEPTTIEQLVKGEFDGLSAAQKKVAEYLLLHPDECALWTAKQISREAGVSEATVIRLAYALGFGNFSDMQQRLRERMLRSSAAAWSVPSAANAAPDEGNRLAGVIENDIAILKQLQQQLDMEELWRAVDSLIRADRVLVAGYRASHATAYWFALMLEMTRDNVLLCPSGGDEYAKLFQLTENSVAVVISFPRYSREIIALTQLAKRQNAKIIAVTDRLLSPVGRISDIALTTEVNAETGMISISSAISLLNLLLYGIQLKDQQQFQIRQQRLEQFYTVSEQYIE
ncbi:MurR/RpiR family transcriptional regulator [Paenibacillus hemerocallicola]|uniref:MurR/RpiR family transcriptional regulator n=1 Tax=Paenibacillus hemerocallicola TaxID=1172614 RepID=A0A5C4TF20_9BACL|nr:MurR/RpiR family transcriptional regulator [Paenibacillus hemerocallicola]TNJ67734.1 MurR/RpiR family transcriptional regulator [Paenibacillus hemerocallicola]